jgi:hypothetical protein
MSVRRVRGVRRSTSGVIRGLCNPAEPWGYRDAADVIRDDLDNLHSYLAVAPDGSEAPIDVVYSPGGPYLRSRLDQTRSDNLETAGRTA